MSAFFQYRRSGLFVGALVLLFLLLVGAGATGWRFYRSATAGAFTLTAAPEGGEAGLGSALKLRYVFAVPWGQSIDQLQFRPSEGWIAVREPEPAGSRWRWGRTETAVELVLRAFRPASGSPGTLTVAARQEYAAPERRQPPLTLNLPDFTVTPAPVDPQSELPLADPLAPPEPSRAGWWWAAGAGALALAVLLLLWVRCRRRQSPLPPEPWEVAARDLAALRRDAGSGGRSAAWCFGRLTDVVRDYLTRRFRLHADRQTTEEFLRTMARGDSPLAPEQERTLEAFLQQADLIKFAGLLPERGAFDRAIDHAEELVRVTTPVPGAEPPDREEKR